MNIFIPFEFRNTSFNHQALNFKSCIYTLTGSTPFCFLKIKADKHTSCVIT